MPSRTTIFRSVLVLLLSCALASCGGGRPVSRSRSAKAAPKKQRYRPVPDFAKGFFIWPLQAPISSGYGKRWGSFHDGIDLDGVQGDAVLAAAPGEVVFSDRLGDYGNLIVLKHEKGLFTAYAHNERNQVKQGDRVKQGQK